MNAPTEEPKNANPEEAGAAGTTPGQPQGPPPVAAPQPRTYTSADSGAGPRWSNAMDPRRKSVALASILSCMPGLGQVYVGYYHLGFIYILVVTGLITILANDAGPFTPLFGLSLAFFWLYNIVDAGRRAALYNTALMAQQGEVPELQVPTNRGSRVGGVLLIIVGVMFLMYTRFDFDMYWVEDWWPLGLIILGGWLFARDRGRDAK